MIIHCILLLLHDIAFRTGEIVAGSIAGFTRAGGILECSWGAGLLGITRETVTDILGHLFGGKRLVRLNSLGLGCWVVGLLTAFSAIPNCRFNFFRVKFR